MEFLKINDNKLKIMLSAEDMEKYSIAPTGGDYEDPAVRRSFWRVLDVAREECGFRISGDKVLMQFYPSSSGGELFVTKLGKIAAGAERTISKSSSVAVMSERRVIYKFSSLDSLVTLAKRLVAIGYTPASDAYEADDGSCYLITEERNVSGYLSETTLFGEFSSEVPNLLEPYVCEHARKIFEIDSIKELARL